MAGNRTESELVISVDVFDSHGSLVGTKESRICGYPLLLLTQRRPRNCIQCDRRVRSPVAAVTYKMVDIVRGSLTVFVIAILAYFSGVLVWKDRDNRMHEIVGATPVPNSALLVSHIVSLMTIVLSIHALIIGLCCLVQWINGYTRFQFGLYFLELIAIDGARFFFLLVIALAAHTVSPNKYVGYFAFIGFVIANNFVWQLFRVETLLVRFGRFPSYTYSDMFGFAPYASGMIWFVIYWVLLQAVCCG